MAEEAKPVLQKPPGYKDPNIPIAVLPKGPQPMPVPTRKPQIPQSFIPKQKQKVDMNMNMNKNPKRRKSCWRCCCCYFCIVFLLIMVLVVLFGSLFYLWFQPKLPMFHLQSLKMARFNVSVNSDGTFLDSQTVVKFQAKNPNEKIRFRYGETKVMLSVGDDIDLGSEVIPGFVQERKNTRILKFGTQNKMVIDDDVGAKLKGRYRNKELVVFVEVRTKFGVRVGSWKMSMVSVRVNCGDVSLKKLEAGATPKCTINLLKW
ncbi:hypothetical protein GIB67_006351 [Kingdonia uniflora]|uniref:Late embryogenesis abundant protein LEA-2 subgroup domain-containing protein n=1 Tax=Kingdonia uniflora TaxID=39325 RepID=A0A7J7P0L4_9MAGN|nr:hypothetical protein GIB67_006351 [Kingdonia uniflora]